VLARRILGIDRVMPDSVEAALKSRVFCRDSSTMSFTKTLMLLIESATWPELFLRVSPDPDCDFWSDRLSSPSSCLSSRVGWTMSILSLMIARSSWKCTKS
jgi:hypothetical protein